MPNDRYGSQPVILGPDPPLARDCTGLATDPPRIGLQGFQVFPMAITRLRLALLEYGIPQYKVAARIGTTDSKVSAWVNGRLPIPARFLSRLAMLLDCDPSDLLGNVTADMDGAPVIY